MPYRKVKYAKSTIKSVPVFEGERIETKVERIVNNKEPISDGAPIQYTEKGELNPNYDHRTDRWEYATENMDVVHRSESAKATPKAPLIVTGKQNEFQKILEGLILPFQYTE